LPSRQQITQKPKLTGILSGTILQWGSEANIREFSRKLKKQNKTTTFHQLCTYILLLYTKILQKNKNLQKSYYNQKKSK